MLHRLSGAAARAATANFCSSCNCWTRLVRMLLAPAAALAADDSCFDRGPWPCAEDGCPAPSVSCAMLSEQFCDSLFDGVWTTLPDVTLGGVTIAAKCPDACGRCAVDYESTCIRSP